MKRRSPAVVTMLLAAAVVTGCAASTSGSGTPAAPASGAPAPSAPPETTRQPPQFAPAVPEPKDARGIAACDLITDAQLVELELDPGSAEETSVPGATRSCSWSSATDEVDPAGLELNDDTTLPVLDGLHVRRDNFYNYELLEVAGHPAVRADFTDRGDCTIATAISDYQGVTTEGDAYGSSADPCGRSIRMAEAILSNLPPLTEE